MTSPIAIVWSPPEIRSRSSHAAHASEPSMIGTPCSKPVVDALELLGLGQLRGEHAGEVLLLGAQDVDGEPARLAHDRQRPGLILEAHERQQRLQRQRAQRVGGHPALARGPGAGDHRHAGGEPAENLAEQLGIGRVPWPAGYTAHASPARDAGRRG